jgi:hypothetical protein
VAAEIEELAARWPSLSELHLEVETIGLARPWAMELCGHLESLNAGRPRPLVFSTNLRVFSGCDFNELFAAMRRANFGCVKVGLESGSETLRRNVLGRNYANEDIVRTVAQLRRNGLQAYLFNLIGIPGETPEEFRKTVEVNRRCQPDRHHTSILYPYPGTRLYALCEQQRLLGQPLGHDVVERSSATLDLPEFPRRDVEKQYVWFDYSVYQGYRPIYRILPRVLEAKLQMYPRLLSLVLRVLATQPGRALKSLFRGPATIHRNGVPPAANSQAPATPEGRFRPPLAEQEEYPSVPVQRWVHDPSGGQPATATCRARSQFAQAFHSKPLPARSLRNRCRCE